MQEALTHASYESAIKAAYLAAQALCEARNADRILRVYAADGATSELLRGLLDELELEEGVGVSSMSAAVRGRNIVALDAIVSAVTRAEVRYDHDEATELLRRLKGL